MGGPQPGVALRCAMLARCGLCLVVRTEDVRRPGGVLAEQDGAQRRLNALVGHLARDELGCVWRCCVPGLLLFL